MQGFFKATYDVPEDLFGQLQKWMSFVEPDVQLRRSLRAKLKSCDFDGGIHEVVIPS